MPAWVRARRKAAATPVAVPATPPAPPPLSGGRLIGASQAGAAAAAAAASAPPLTVDGVVAAAEPALRALWTEQATASAPCLTCLLMAGAATADDEPPHTPLRCPLFGAARVCSVCRSDACTAAVSRKRCEFFAQLVARDAANIKFCWQCCRPWTRRCVRTGAGTQAALLCGGGGQAPCRREQPEPRPIVLGLCRLVAEGAAQGALTPRGAFAARVCSEWVRLFGGQLMCPSEGRAAEEVVRDVAWQQPWELVRVWSGQRGLSGGTALVTIAWMLSSTVRR